MEAIEELHQVQDVINNDTTTDLISLMRRSSELDIPQDSISNHNESDNECSEDEDVPMKKILKRVRRFTDSDSDVGREKTQIGDISGSEDNDSQIHNSLLKVGSDDSKNDDIVPKSIPFKSRIQSNGNLSGSESSDNNNSNKNNEQQLRMRNKRSKLRSKFKSLITSREKEVPSTNIENGGYTKSDSNSSSESGEEMASIEKIKQKIRERMSFKPSICDPDTSDEESTHQTPVFKQKKERKMTKPTSPKPQRISAKQAMENMQKIKSESNRMLREKEVSLPYHRPKALSLKDIMTRRKLAVSSDGKALPIKMNEHQLRQYAQMLEERQKEMMELCKSESEEETNENLAEVEKDTTLIRKEDKNTNLNPDDPLFTENGSDINNITNIENNIDSNTISQDIYNENAEENCSIDKNANQLPKDQDSESSMELIYNDSANSLIDDKLIDEEQATSSTLASDNVVTAIPKNTEPEITTPNEIECISESKEKHEESLKTSAEVDSQLMLLHFDTENTDDSIEKETTKNATKVIKTRIEVSINDSEDNSKNEEKRDENKDMEIENEFSDDDINISDIDNIIENAEIIKDIEDKVNSQILIRDKPFNLNPILTGAPGMVIDLDDSDTVPRKSGIELLKERFTYFSKLKTPEEMEREREKKLKPGTQLKKLKQELEEKIAEQRSLEWAKRLEDEKQQRKELQELRGEESDENDIDKIEAAIEEKEGLEKSESEEEEPIEDDIEIKDKPRVKNSMLDDEAEESDCEENEDNDYNENRMQNGKNEDDGIDADNDDDDEEDNKSESDESNESSESEDEETSTTKKGRILKAFEDSDEEDAAKPSDQPLVEIKAVEETGESKSGSSGVTENFPESQVVSQDEELQLAQRPKSTSDDLFTSQESALLASEAKEQTKDVENESFTQTFSILDSSKQITAELDLNSSEKLSVVDITQSLDIANLDTMRPITDSQNNFPLPSLIPTTQLSQSQPIGEDVFALCTGQFYNNQFVSQIKDNQTSQDELVKYSAFDNYASQDSQEEDTYNSEAVIPSSIGIENEKENIINITEPVQTENIIKLNGIEDNKENAKHKFVDDNLKSILDELADPEFDSPKPNKFFVGSKNAQRAVENETQLKKRFVIESDDEVNDGQTVETTKRKKFKKKKPEKRALQISDDEDELSEQEELEEYESDIEEDDSERLVEYDSEENEIEVKPQNSKKKRKMAEFFENEAELTSEDEWVGSGDEDEAGLDRMEREEGDDEIFHQGKLRRELGQIHMRDVLDQDKREVRLIQELLFEDGDLGGGGRQRKFRWNNLDGDAETGTVPDEFADTQEEEFESEELWRKQRHERETFLREMKNKDDPDESLSFSVDRTTFLSKSMLSSFTEVNNSNTEKTDSSTVEKKTAKDIPSPKKPFALLQLQQSYQGSLLSRGRGALARLAALAAPLAADDEGKVGSLGPTSRRNFVFTALTPEEKEPKVTKRKAESNPNTPKLVKKMRSEEKQNTTKSSLLDRIQL